MEKQKQRKIKMNTKQKFMTEFILLLDEYEIVCDDMTNPKFIYEVYDLAVNMLKKGKNKKRIEMTNEDKKELEELFYSWEFGHVAGHEWMMDDSSLEMLWKWINDKIRAKLGGKI